MSLTFGKTTADNFGRIFEDNPRVLTRNPYLNYLRYYKSRHPSYNLGRMLQLGSKSWCRLRPSQRELFTQKNVLGSVPRPHIRSRAGPAKRFGPSHSTRVPSHRMPMSYKRRSMSTARNVRNRERIIHRLPRYRLPRYRLPRYRYD